MDQTFANPGASTDTAPTESPVGGPEAYLRLHRAALLVERPDLVPLRIGGPDRLDFVHGQLSNDVRGLEVGACNRSLQLSHKGHVLASATAIRRADDLYLAVEANGEALLASLRRHVVFDQVDIEDLRGTLTTWSLMGGAVAALLAATGIDLPAAGHFSQVEVAGAAVLLHAAPWSAYGGVDLHLLLRDVGAVSAFLLEQGAESAPASLFDLARVEAGVATAADAGEGVLPQEIGLVDAVSYRKGCYLGQEIMARIEARGNLRRGPARIVLASDPGPDRRDIEVDGRKVGRAGVVVQHPDGRYLALAALRSDLAADASAAVAAVPLLAVDRL